jgi:hypothetical protein
MNTKGTTIFKWGMWSDTKILHNTQGTKVYYNINQPIETHRSENVSIMLENKL